MILKTLKILPFLLGTASGVNEDPQFYLDQPKRANTTVTQTILNNTTDNNYTSNLTLIGTCNYCYGRRLVNNQYVRLEGKGKGATEYYTLEDQEYIYCDSRTSYGTRSVYYSMVKINLPQYVSGQIKVNYYKLNKTANFNITTLNANISTSTFATILQSDGNMDDWFNYFETDFNIWDPQADKSITQIEMDAARNYMTVYGGAAYNWGQSFQFWNGSTHGVEITPQADRNTFNITSNKTYYLFCFTYIRTHDEIMPSNAATSRLPMIDQFEYSLNITLQDPAHIYYQVVDIPGLMFDILTLPFSFISQAFNLTLFPGTPYSVNISGIFLSIIAVLIFAFILKKILGTLR